MKQITSLWLLMFFFASTSLFAQNASTGLAKQAENAELDQLKMQQIEQQSPLSEARTSTVTPSPNVTDDEVIRYDDGVNNDAIGLTAGGTFEVSAYWPASTMGQYAGMQLSQVEVYINDLPDPFVLKIYDAGTTTVPGALLHEETVSVTALSWNVIELSQPVDISGDDIWIGYEVTHAVDEFVAGCDAGPAVAGFGDMISLDGITFEPMSGLGLNYNWNIASTLVEGGPQPTNDVGVMAITSPNDGVELTDAEPVTFTIKNYGTDAQSDIDWEVTWDGPTGFETVSGTFTGPLASGETTEIDAGTADLSTYGEYDFEACTSLSGDENPANDCKEKTVTNIEPSLCVDNLYSSGCDFGDGLIAWSLENVDVPNIPCEGTPPWYHDYTDQVHMLPPGDYELTVTAGYGSTNFDVWIDFNDDLDLTDDELVLDDAVCADANVPYTFTLTVPASADPGEHILRFRTNWIDPVLDACETYTYGNACDFKAMIGDPLTADVGVASIDMATFYEPGTVTPMATVKNFGTDTQSFDVTLTIDGYSSTMSVSDLASGDTEQVTFDDWDATEGTYTAEACTDLSGDENPNNDCKTLDISVMVGQFVYAYNAYDPSGGLVEGPVTFDITNPGIVNLLAPTSSGDFIAGGVWAAETWWGVQYGGGLYTIDTETGDMTFVGNSPDLSGLAFDGTTVYGASITDLYEIDPATGQGTLIGSMGNPSALMIAIGCNAAGDLYGYDIGDDIFYSIDKGTGAATAVGPLGFDFNFAQDMAFDKANDICYLSGYTSTGGLYTVDVATGSASFIGEFQGGAEITGFAIPGAAPDPVGDPPAEFTADFVEEVGVEMTWVDPDPSVPGTWVGYDDGVNEGGLGLNGGGTFWGAARWEPADLTPFDGLYMTQFQFFPMLFATEADLKFMIWEGADAGTLVYEQVLTDLTWNEWNTITLDEMHMIDASTELWIGLEVSHVDGENPFGFDGGPATAGFGDMVSFDGSTWESMANAYSIDNNFNLQAFIADEVDGVVGDKQPLPMPEANITSTEFSITENKPSEAPANSRQLVLEGINIYRDGSLVNDDPVAPGTEEYTDAFFQNGTYIYTAKAVYDDGLSAATPGVEVEITGAQEIEVTPASLSELHDNPPEQTTQELTISNLGGMDLEWEATVSLTRAANATPIDLEAAQKRLEERMAAEGITLPGAGEEQSPTAPRNVINNTDEQWDVLYTFSAQAPSCQAVATDGQNFYMTYWNGAGEFDKFDMEGNYIESFTIASAAAIRDMAYDGQYFYGAPAGGMSIAQLDLANQTVVSTITIASDAGVTGSRHLAYDPELDGGNGGFWLGQWGELAAVDMSGNTIHANADLPDPASCYGSAYDPWTDQGSPKLWLFTQNAGASPNDLVLLEEFDINTLSFTGNTLDVFTISGDIPGYIPGTAADPTLAGGVVTYVDASNMFVLAANIQQSPNLVVGLELAPVGPPLTTDVSVLGITSPNSGIELTDAEPVMFTIKNNGTASQSNIPWEITWDGPTGSETVSGTFTGTLAGGETTDIDAGTADLSVLGDYDFEACTSLAGDENPDNDCKTKTVTHEFPEYCDASTTTEDEWIANVLCGDIDNSSGWQGGVADYTDISTTIAAGASEDITITNGNAWDSDIVTCWVDWNMDYEFGVGTDEEFTTVNVGGTGEVFEGTISVPAGTPAGEYRMRVRMTYSTPPEPCGNASYGEVEDYTIVVSGSGGGDWLSVDPMSGTIGGGDSETLTVTFDSEGLDDGTYNGSIMITSNDAVNPMVEVPVTLVVEGDLPVISWDPDSFAFALDVNDEDTQELEVSNDGGSMLECQMSITYGEASSPVAPQPQYENLISPDQLDMANTGMETPSPNVTEDEVIRYDDGVNNDAIGLTAPGTFEVSAYWPASSMSQYSGMELTHVEVYINDLPDPFVLKIYDAGTPTVPGALLHEETVSVAALNWNLIELSEPVEITGDDIWIGYSVTHGADEFPAGCDAGPAVAGFGDMISLDGVTFEPMSGLGLNYNWNIAATLTGEATVDWLSISPDSGSIPGGESAMFDVTASSYNFPGPMDETYHASIWMDNNDPENPMVEVPVTLEYPVGLEEGENGAAYIMMFPNPTKEIVNISTNYEINQVAVLNQAGQVVLEKAISGKSVQLNTKSLQAGVYFVKIQSSVGESVHKLIIQ